MQDVFNFLKENPTFYVATVDGDEPQVRPFGAIDLFEGRFYIQTGNVKNVFQQMKKNPKIAICTVGKNGRWLRISATAVQDDRMDARQHMLDANPGLKKMYAADDGNCEVLYLKDATATFYSFTAAPDIHKF